MGTEVDINNTANRFGLDWTILDIIMDKRLQWLSHLGRMCDERLRT